MLHGTKHGKNLRERWTWVYLVSEACWNEGANQATIVQIIQHSDFRSYILVSPLSTCCMSGFLSTLWKGSLSPTCKAKPWPCHLPGRQLLPPASSHFPLQGRKRRYHTLKQNKTKNSKTKPKFCFSDLIAPDSSPGIHLKMLGVPLCLHRECARMIPERTSMCFEQGWKVLTRNLVTGLVNSMMSCPHLSRGSHNKQMPP